MSKANCGTNPWGDFLGMLVPALASRGRARPCIPTREERVGNGSEAGRGVEAGAESKARWPAECASDNFQLLPQLLP